MIDQPEVYLAPDSPYKGIKPAKLNVIAEAFRDAVSQALSSDYTIVSEAGPDTLYLKMALTDLSVTEKHKKVLGFTPVGRMYKAGRSTVQSNYQNAVQYISLLDLKIEGELLEAMQRFGEVFQCQLDNVRAEPDDRVNCRSGSPAG